MGTISHRSTLIRSRTWYREGLHSHGYGKKIKRSIPKQVQKVDDMEKWPRNRKDTISYHSVVMRTEAIRYRTAFRTCLVSTGDTKLTTSDVEVEIRPNCNSSILPIVWSFETRSLTSTVYPLINLMHVNV